MQKTFERGRYMGEFWFNKSFKTTIRTIAIVLGTIAISGSMRKAAGSSYAVVISKTAYADAGWKKVADSLSVLHASSGRVCIVTWNSSVKDAADSLAVFKPDYIGFIARPATECNAAFVVAVSRMCRALDDDPYGDAVWGIITGYEAADALRAISDTLEVKTVLCASSNLSYEPPIERFYQAIGMPCDNYTKTDYLFPGQSGKVYSENKRPGNENDRINIVGKWMESSSLSLSIPQQGDINGPIDCIITGGHGNVNLWQCHYSDAGSEGYLQSSGGALKGLPYNGSAFAITATTPKIWWCASNCLMGNPNSKDNIVYAAFHSGRAVQMYGFVNDASAGDEFMAWGTYDRVTKCAGKLTLPQGYFISNNNAQFELEHPTGQMTTQQVRLFMDSTALYGDPAAKVRFHDVGDSAHAYKADLSYEMLDGKKARFTYAYTMVAHDLEFGAGYCYQFRPIALLPVRIDPGSVAFEKNEGHSPVVTENLLIWEMLAKGEKLLRGKTKTLVWTATVTGDAVVPVVSAPVRHAVNPVSASIDGRLVTVSGLHAGTWHARIVGIDGKILGETDLQSSGSGRTACTLSRRMTCGIAMVMLGHEKERLQLRIVLDR